MVFKTRIESGTLFQANRPVTFSKYVLEGSAYEKRDRDEQFLFPSNGVFKNQKDFEDGGGWYTNFPPCFTNCRMKFKKFKDIVTCYSSVEDLSVGS